MKRILCLGDSNTYGFDPRSYFGSRYPAEIRWTDRIAREGYTILNEGENGRRILREDSFPMVNRIIRDSSPLSGIIVMLGTNDILTGAAARQAREHMGRLVSFVATCTEPEKVLLLAPPPLKRGEWVQDDRLIRESENLGKEYAELARMCGIGFADAGEWGIDLTFDGVHFSPEGHRRMAQKIRDILDREF